MRAHLTAAVVALGLFCAAGAGASPFPSSGAGAGPFPSADTEAQPFQSSGLETSRLLSPPGSAEHVITAAHTNTPPVIDGVIDDAE